MARDTLAALPNVQPFPFQRQSGMFFYLKMYRPENIKKNSLK